MLPFTKRRSTRSLCEGRAAWHAAHIFRRRRFAPIELFDQVGEQSPEERVARIAADAAELAAVIDQHEHRREALALDEGEVGGLRLGDIDPAQRRALPFGGLVIGGRDLAVEAL